MKCSSVVSHRLVPTGCSPLGFLITKSVLPKGVEGIKLQVLPALCLD